ncbi:YacL family protein [Gallaecimonas pentaromativorans]|uniref:Uncharacterized protein n=1 Tax=Gallaecimonas pentaromativorans TaxID=584787 RepID=A0A3N1PFL4_9GAMM|nr:YacL family protein [Gallaecimonas pentaromativorans]ROQ30734.1 hypothetical protein EDC28_101426 [Gallaecimonas pentaromativorans]
MEYQFRLNPFDGRHQIQMEYGFEAMGRFIEDELGTDKAKISTLIARLQQGRDLRFEGHEWALVVEQGELSVLHHRLDHNEVDLDPDLALDDADASSHCGLEDGLLLLQAWLDFVAPL